jgi:hypothetical protein
MRVLIVADRLSLRGGADHYLCQLYGALKTLGVDLRLLVGRVDGDLNESAEWGVLPEVTVLRGLSRPTASSARLSGLEEAYQWADRVVAQNVMNPVALNRLRGHSGAVFLIQDHRHFCPGMGKSLEQGERCEQTMSLELCKGCLPDVGYRQRTLDLTRSRAAAVAGAPLVVLSQYMRDELTKVGLSGARIIPPGLTVKASDSMPRRGYLLGGRLVRHKAPLLAVEAWKRSGTTEPLWIAGAGPLEPDIREAARDGTGRIEMLGWLSGSELKERLCGVRALLFPGHWQEPFGILGVEALAQATPVVLAAEGGTGDWSSMGCRRVRPGGVDAMASALRDLEADAPMAQRLGESGREYIRANFPVQRFRSAWMELLSEEC